MKKRDSLRVNATKMKEVGDYPNYILLGHRHLEKEMPNSGGQGGGAVEFVLPLDLLRMTINPQLVDEIAEVRLAYKKS